MFLGYFSVIPTIRRYPGTGGAGLSPFYCTYLICIPLGIIRYIIATIMIICSMLCYWCVLLRLLLHFIILKFSQPNELLILKYRSVTISSHGVDDHVTDWYRFLSWAACYKMGRSSCSIANGNLFTSTVFIYTERCSNDYCHFQKWTICASMCCNFTIFHHMEDTDFHFMGRIWCLFTYSIFNHGLRLHSPFTEWTFFSWNEELFMTLWIRHNYKYFEIANNSIILLWFYLNK